MAGACPPGAAGLEGDLMESDVVVGPSTGSEKVDGERAIRIASWLFLINGIAWGLGSIPNAIYRSQLGRMPRIGELETMGGPVSSQFGWEGVVWFLIPMGLLAWVEVLTGWWLRKRQKQGGWLAIVSLPVWMFFPVVFLLPLWIALGPIRVALVVAGWRALR